MATIDATFYSNCAIIATNASTSGALAQHALGRPTKEMLHNGARGVGLRAALLDCRGPWGRSQIYLQHILVPKPYTRATQTLGATVDSPL